MLISLGSILTYLGEGVRPITEGERVFLAGHILLCGLVDEKIFARCLQSSQLSGSPHKIEINLRNDFEFKFKQWQCICSCKAGAGGKCKHIVAVLLHLNSVEDLSLLSCTDVEQIWGKVKTKKSVDVIPVEKFCHVKARDGNVATSQPNFLQTFLAAAEDSEAAVHQGQTRAATCILEAPFIRDECHSLKMERIILHSNSSPFTNVLNTTSITLMECCGKTFNKIYPCDPIAVCKNTFLDKEMWARERQFRITASRCYNLFTYSMGRNWQEKAKKYFFPVPFSNSAMEYGRFQESHAREVYKQQKTVEVVECGLCVFPQEPWLAVSPDGVIMGDDRQPVRLLEIKCPIIGKEKSVLNCLPHLKYLKKDGENFTLRKKDVYYGQIQLCMCVLGLESCDFVIFSSKDKSIYTIPTKIDVTFCNDLLLKLKNIFFSEMLHTLCNIESI